MENMGKSNSSQEPQKTKSIIRWEALGIFAALAIVFLLYVFFLLEFHLKWIAEKTAFESLGTEVNIQNIDVDFFEPSLLVNRIQITNPDKPLENSMEIEKVKVNFSYAPLIKGAFVSEKTEVLGIKFHTQRERAGRVLPKEKRLLVLKDPSRAKVHDALKGKFKESAFADLVNLFREDKRDEVAKQYKNKLKTLKVSEAIEKQTKGIKEKTKDIEKKISSPEVKELLKEVKAFKFESGSTKESIDSAARALKLIENLKAKRKEIKNEVSSLKSEIGILKSQIESAPEKFLKDSRLLKASLDPGQMSPDKISEEILSEYFSLQLSQLDRVTSSLKKQALGDKAKYVESSGSTSEVKSGAQNPNQISLEKGKEEIYRKYGKNIIFYKAALLPKYWFKKILISSKASSGQDFGDVSGEILNFSASPELLTEPMIVKIKGSVPKQGIGAFVIDSTVDHRKIGEESEKISIEVSDYLVKGLELFSGSDEVLKVVKSNAKTVLNVFLKNNEINLVLNQTLRTPLYEVFAKDKNIESLMNRLKTTAEDLNLTLKASGDIKKPKLRISSNIGDLLISVVKDEMKSQAKAVVSKELKKLNESAIKTLGPYVEDIDLASVKAGDVGKIFDKEIEKGLAKLKKNDKTKKIKKKILKELFKRF